MSNSRRGFKPVNPGLRKAFPWGPVWQAGDKIDPQLFQLGSFGSALLSMLAIVDPILSCQTFLRHWI